MEDDVPTSPLALCVVTGCPNRVPYGRCNDHRLQARREQEAGRPSAHARGYDRDWQATRREYLDTHPRCQHPDCAATATDVDHVDGLGPRGPRGHDWRNLQALCHAHHSSKTARENGGFGRRA